MAATTLIDRLIEAFQVLPGVGPKSAQRMVLNLLQKNRSGGRHLAELLTETIDRVGECEACRNLSENRLCPLCEDLRRDDRIMCIVESPADILALEHAGGFRGGTSCCTGICRRSTASDRRNWSFTGSSGGCASSRPRS